jgi:hypothetical protein
VRDFVEGDVLWTTVGVVPEGFPQLLVAVYLPVSAALQRFLFGLRGYSGLKVGLGVGLLSDTLVQAGIAHIAGSPISSHAYS